MQVQIQLDEKYHKVLKYRSAQYGKPMGKFIEDLLRALKQRALRIHRKLGSGSFIDDSIIVRAILEGDARGWDEQGIMDLVAVDMTEAEADGVEATFEANVDG